MLYSVMRERRFAGPQRASAPATEQAGGRYRMVRRTKRPGRHQARRRQQPGYGVKTSHLERLVARERGKDRRQSPRKHRLARTGRADQQDVVATGGRDLERPTGLGLPANLGEVDRE